MADYRGRRSPDDIARAKAVAAQVMEKQKKIDGLKEVKKGRTYIFITAGIFCLNFIIDYFQVRVWELLYFYAPIIALYVVLGIYYYRNPLVISVVALSIFGTIILVLGLIEPLTIVSGWLFKILIISALISSIKSARLYNEDLVQKQKANDDILDDELLV